jgi:glycosyltransferase involved in cell wall biosynthesis
MQEREEAPMEVLILNWRDQTHPHGGGSEVFAETVAEGLARRGHRVTIFCAAHENAGSETITAAGVRIVRAGGRLTVYSRAVMAFWRGRLGRPDVIVDVQNGLPFLARLWSRKPVVLLCHHVHREQWAVVLGPRAARFGWWVESQLSPVVHRGCRYVTVSDVSRREIAELGVDQTSIGVVHNGVDVPAEAVAPRSGTPLLVVLGRLVPHKRVEYALEVVARLRDQIPGLRLVVAGRGWWHDEIETHRASLGLTSDEVVMQGWIDEDEKDRLLSSAWLSLVPSLKEGWGIAVMEAAAHGTPSIAFRDAGGVAESVVDGVTGLLVDDLDGFVDATRRLLLDTDLREAYGARAREHARAYSWGSTVADVEKILRDEVIRHDDGDGSFTASTRTTLP